MGQENKQPKEKEGQTIVPRETKKKMFNNYK